MVKMLDTTIRTEIPGPPGIRALNYLRFLRNPAFYVLDRLAAFTSNPVVPVSSGSGALVLAHGESTVKKFFTENDAFERADGGIFALPKGHDWSRMFDTVLTANGIDHRRRRKLIAPVFHRDMMDHYDLTFQETFKRSRFAQSGTDQFDAVAEFRLIARTNMLVCLLGLPPTEENLKLASDISALLESMFHPAIILMRSPKSWTPYGRWTRRVESAYRQLAILIERRRREEPKWDALSVLCHTVDDQGEQLTPQEIAGELHGLFAAGYETTASAMIWSLVTCLSQPNSGLDNLVGVIKETQRLIPTVAVSLPRRAIRTVELDQTASVPPGTVVFASPLLEHRNPEIFPEPEQFRPDRWTDFRPSPYAFLPFGIGTRRCPGASFADLQVHTTLQLLLQDSGWSLASTHVGYSTKTGVISFPDKPLVVSRGRSAPLEKISGPLTKLWRPQG